MTASIALSVDDPVVAPGEDVAVTVTVSGEDVSRLRVELFYRNEYLRPGPSTSTSSSSGDSFVELAGDLAVEASSGPEEEHEAFVVVAMATPASGDGPVTGEHALRLHVPDDAPSSAGTVVQWKVRAMVDGAGGAEEEATADVIVATTLQAGAATLDTSVRWDEGFAFLFPHGQAVRAGEALSGTLIVTPVKDVSLTEIRLDAKATRKDHDGIKHEKTIATVVVTGKGKLEEGTRHEFPFTLPIPADALPDFTADNNRNYNLLFVSAARRLRGDLMAATELFVAAPQAR
jgi:hypothetical protein